MLVVAASLLLTGAIRVLALAVALAVVTAVTAWRYARRLGGVTGDLLGATEQLCELTGYTVLAWGVH